MDLRLYDTLTREKRPFVPLDPARVRMYVCGPTVYDFAHIGNARPVIVFDVLFRLLRHFYGPEHVIYVRNITDVDDKINARAAERGIAIRELTEETYRNFKEDVAALGCLPPTVEPRATEHIAEMKTLIEQLVASGNAYVAEEHVLFSVPTMRDYGRLARRSLDEMMAGARVDVAPYKRDPMDFVLWKPSKPGEPAWPSPSGIATPGRPGWHIECSAMSWKHLGETFDIHGGGIDLVFPHHENEIAQSRCAFHTPVMANYWMHNGFLQVEGEKMSKSLGNFVTIRELRKTKRFGGRKWPGRVLKFAMLQTHYREPIDWTVRLLEQAESRLERWRNFVAERTLRRTNKALMQDFLLALQDDLNTANAFAVVDRAVNSEHASDEDRYTVYRILRILGIKAKRTRVAKIAEEFDSLRWALMNISQTRWEEFVRTASADTSEAAVRLKPESYILASLQAIAKYWQSLKSESNLPLQIMPTIEEERRQLRMKHLAFEIADKSVRSVRALGHFSKNDWSNFLHTAVYRPQFRSGKLKPETKLLLNLSALSNLEHSLDTSTSLHSPDLLRVRDELLAEAKPAESQQEVQIRRLVAERELARKEKRYSDADRIRNELAGMGVVLKDSKDGPTWEILK